jgi:glutamate/tyrosine decarboxylase-like PLP-dependent enzyme
MRSLEAIGSADSITIDPHKLGYVPYACGAFIARSLESYESFQVRAPYLKAEESALAGWTTTLEGSRSAAGAAAVWLTARTLPLNHEGFGRILEKTIEARLAFASSLETIPGVHLVSPLDTNVLCFAVSRAHDTIAASNEKTLALFAQIEQGPHFSVSRTTLLRAHYSKMIARLCRERSLVDDGVSDLSVVRLVLMNPFIVSKEMKTDFAAVFAAEIGLLLEGRCE